MIQKILNKIHEEQDGLMDAQGNFASAKNEGAYHVLCDLEAYIESLAKKPVSEDLEEAWRKTYEKEKDEILVVYDHHAGFVAGANWQKEQMMKDAISCKIEYNNKWHINLITDPKIMEEYVERKSFKHGDKGKLIIIMED